MTLQNEIEAALTKLEAVVDQTAEYYGCAWHNGNLSLNTTAAYERMPKMNHIWEPDDWEGKDIVQDWFTLHAKNESAVVSLLTTVYEKRTELFPNCAEYFDVLFLTADDKAIGLEKIRALFHDDRRLSQDYYKAVISGDLVAAASLLGQIDDVNLEVDTGEFFKPTLLEIAIKQSAIELIQILAERGADLEKGCHHSHDPVVLSVLTKLGAPIDLGYERLIAAASEETNLPELKFLLSQGAEINAQNSDGQTALLRAVGNDNPQTVEFLLSQGARTDLKSNYGDVFEIADSEKMQTLLAPYH